MAAARKRELDFFQSSPHYAGLKNVGTGYLSSKLADHLTGAIRRQLPSITQGIADGIAGLEKELASLGGPVIEGRGGMIHLLLQLCRQFEESFCQAGRGRGVGWWRAGRAGPPRPHPKPQTPFLPCSERGRRQGRRGADSGHF